MVNKNPFRDYDAEIFDLKGNHLGSIFTSTREDGEPYKIGGEIPISDLALYQNNSKRIRKCLIRRISKTGPNNYNLFIEPTKEDLKYKNIDLDSRIDNDGYDGWLRPPKL